MVIALVLALGIAPMINAEEDNVIVHVTPVHITWRRNTKMVHGWQCCYVYIAMSQSVAQQLVAHASFSGTFQFQWNI